jgi:hypothetical protein
MSQWVQFPILPLSYLCEASIKKRLAPLVGLDSAQFHLSARNVMLQDHVVLQGLQNNEAVVIHPYVLFVLRLMSKFGTNCGYCGF